MKIYWNGISKNIIGENIKRLRKSAKLTQKELAEKLQLEGYEFSDLNLLLPNEISDSLKEAFPNFGRKIKGFDNKDTILAGIESRTSSPVRIIRCANFESNIKGIYPCGEGAGYAGGITSAAIDGIKVAEAIASKYKPFDN